MSAVVYGNGATHVVVDLGNSDCLALSVREGGSTIQSWVCLCSRLERSVVYDEDVGRSGRSSWNTKVVNVIGGVCRDRRVVVPSKAGSSDSLPRKSRTRCSVGYRAHVKLIQRRVGSARESEEDICVVIEDRGGTGVAQVRWCRGSRLRRPRVAGKVVNVNELEAVSAAHRNRSKGPAVQYSPMHRSSRRQSRTLHCCIATTSIACCYPSREVCPSK
jgi:hypothetical protein